MQYFASKMTIDFGVFTFKRFMLGLTEDQTHLHTYFSSHSLLFVTSSRHLSTYYLHRFSSVSNECPHMLLFFWFVLPLRVGFPARTFKSMLLFSAHFGLCASLCLFLWLPTLLCSRLQQLWMQSSKSSGSPCMCEQISFCIP